MNHKLAALRSGLLLAPLLVPAAAAYAQHDIHEQADENVVVTGHTVFAQTEVDRIAGGADQVRAEDYDEKLAVSLRDALAFSPGVYAQPRFGQEVRLSIRGSGISRGFHMRGLTLLQDGVPINLADDNGDFQELDPLILDRIEIFRGANAMRFGGSTLGGAVNGITPTGHIAPGLDARIDGGSFDTVRGKLAYGVKSDRIDGWFALTGDRSDGDRDHSSRDSLRLHGNVAVRLSDSVETHFLASAQKINQELPGALDLAAATNAPETGSFFGDQQRDINSLRIQNRTHIELGDALLEIGGFANLKDLFHPIFQVVDQESTDWGAFARMDLERGPLEVRVGATARLGTVDAKRFVNVNGERGAQTFAADQDARTIDVYGEARYAFGDISLIGGALYTNGLRDQDQVLPAVVSGKAKFDQFSPRFGLLWQAAQDVQLYANVSRSHELPGFIELAQIAAFVPLDAQHAWTTEIGGRGRIGIASFDLSLYRAQVRNELLQFTVSPDIPASTFNADRTLHQGIEAGLDLDLAPWLRLRQVYQLNDFRFRDDAQYGDNRLPVIPKHLYRAELRIGDEKRHVSPMVEWVPKGAWADYRNSLRVEGYAMLGISGEAALDERFSVFADVRNITGKKAVGDIGAVVAATPASVIFYPVERRAVYGGVRARF
jgi:iron complex outermembrane receptor protein